MNKCNKGCISCNKCKDATRKIVNKKHKKANNSRKRTKKAKCNRKYKTKKRNSRNTHYKVLKGGSSSCQNIIATVNETGFEISSGSNSIPGLKLNATNAHLSGKLSKSTIAHPNIN